MNLAGRNLLQDKTRLLLSVAGVALAIMLILILTGFVSRMNLQILTYLDHAPGSVVLVQAGTRGASSVLPAETADMAGSVVGVSSAVPIVTQYAVLDLGQTKQYVRFAPVAAVFIPAECVPGVVGRRAKGPQRFDDLCPCRLWRASSTMRSD